MMKLMTDNGSKKEFYSFDLLFKGQLVENSVDAFDVANTILATSSALQEIAIIKYGNETAESIKININAFQKGSLLSQFLIYLRDNVIALSPLMPEIARNGYTIGKEMLGGLKTVIDIKELLKGKPPKEIKQINPTTFEIHTGDNSEVTVNNFDFRALQSKEIARNVAKMVSPLIKPQSELTTLDMIEKGKKVISITRELAPYLESKENIQTVNKVKFKGVVSKIDTKVCSGYIDVGSKRIPFIYPKELPMDKFSILVESLRTKIQVYLIGDVNMDYESNAKNIIVIDIESEAKLF